MAKKAWFHYLNSNCSHFITFYSILMVDSSFFPEWYEVFNYGKIIFILCLLSTKTRKTYKSKIWGQFFFRFTPYFFEKIIFLKFPTSKIFLWEKLIEHFYPVEKIWSVLLYAFILKIAILTSLRCFLGLFWPSIAKNEQKNVNRQTTHTQKYFHKNCTRFGYISE